MYVVRQEPNNNKNNNRNNIKINDNDENCKNYGKLLMGDNGQILAFMSFML